MNEKRAFEILGLPAGATRFEVRQAYHDLLHVWQPDRVGKNVRLQKRAQDQIGLINEAYALLEAALPKGAEGAARESRQTPGLMPEEGESADLGTPAEPQARGSGAGDKGGFKGFEPVPVVDLEYVPDGPPAPKVPLAARLRETKAEVGQNVSKGVRTAIPFRRKHVLLACAAVVAIPVAAFYLMPYFRKDAAENGVNGYGVEPVGSAPQKPAATADAAPGTADQVRNTPGPEDATTAATAPGGGTPGAATEVANGTEQKQEAHVTTTEPAAPADPRVELVAELAKLHVTPPAESTQEQLEALLVRAKMASDLARAGFQLDPQKVSLEMLKEYQMRADLAGQINQLADARIMASDFSLSALREMKLSAQAVHEIAENGTKVSLNRYTLTELQDLLARSAVAHQLQTDYGVKVDITAHPIEELQLMLKHAQERAATHP